ncbi:GNAT family N-acetyltransferase [Rhizobium laguerreae]|uniref:GNAT family N-acetyltransferase n=1 Tax=Rhizobium laguerreae TaxID=1076926 RepID=A0AB35FDQ9_9HYPH|nr:MULTISPECIES: GNAT family N-acetyltransferase [Rhizobium/Agrobacterium group]MBY3064799.1 GNAT family N-acetyltransferase [Rhizobium laguerreae]MBY3088948.1 GNAT family N-acetyltransferase [Rhizobium laguerreae]MBY3130034.1 GNAT family N-acetyltransferase [Rhizobium laguerreae]MBY3149273.1 GNAT family N-acetyltransferase [Rhizobium laguerreae]MBY3252365.1 GNAT family N-acetyltransferase [Rhizobium laguerreae]
MESAPIETERLILRRPGASDIEAYTAYCLSGRSALVGGPFDEVRAFDKLAAMIGHWVLRGFGRYVFVLKLTNRSIGHVGALQLDWREPPEMSWTIWSGADEGQGYALEASRAYLEHALGALATQPLIARIHRDNLESRKLASRLGGILDDDAVAPAWSPQALTYRFSPTRP